MKFWVVEYTQSVAMVYGNEVVTCYRLYDYEFGEASAKTFCKEMNLLGEKAEIRIRDIDPSIFQ